MTHMTAVVLDWVAPAFLILAAAGSFYTVVAVLLLGRFAARPVPRASRFPSITVLKPLRGAEPGLYDNLASFCRQDYPGPVQIVFGVRDVRDPAVPVVRRLMADLPQADLELVVDATEYGANGKISNLANMQPHATNDLLVLSDSDIAVELGNMPLQSGHAGLGTPVKIDPSQDETKEPFIMMNNQYDIVFLLERARRHGYQVIYYEKSDSNPQPSIFFGPPESKRVVPNYRLVWGKTLTSFKPKFDTGMMLAEVTWRGWDRKKDELIEQTAKWDDPDIVPSAPERQQLQLIAQAYGARKEVRVTPPPRSKEDAKQFAKDTLTRQFQQMITASGSTVGLPDLRAGTKVQIEGLGLRYSGKYYITSTTHTMGEGGYRTQFEARRDPADQ